MPTKTDHQIPSSQPWLGWARMALAVVAIATGPAAALADEERSAAPVCLVPRGSALLIGQQPESVASSTARPTGSLKLEPTALWAGQRFAAEGSVGAGAAGARLWWFDRRGAHAIGSGPPDPRGAARIAAEVARDQAPGAYRVCLLANGVDPSEPGGSCGTLTVRPTPPGSLSGVILIAARDGSTRPAPDADVRLTTPSGAIVATTRTDREGRYSFGGLPPGRYRVRPSADGVPFDEAESELSAGGSNALDVVSQNMLELPIARVDAVAAIVLPLGDLAPSGFKSAIPISDDDRERDGSFWARFGSLPAAQLDVIVKFYADATFFAGPNAQRGVRFEVLKNGQVLQGSTAQQPETVYAGDGAYDFLAYARLFNLRDWPAGDLTLKVTPIVDGVDGPSRSHLIRMVDLGSRWFNQHVVDPPQLIRVFPGFPELVYHFIGNASRPLLPISEPIDVLVKTFSNVVDGRAVVSEGFHTRDGFVDAVATFWPEVTVFDQQLIAGSYHYQVSYDAAGQPSYDLAQFTAAGPEEFLSIPLYENGPGVSCWDPCPDFCCGDCDICAGWRIWADVTVGGQIDLQSVIGKQLAYSFDVIPTANVTIGGHARAELVFCRAKGNITGTAQVGLPLHYDNHTPVAAFEAPCVSVSGHLDASLGCFGFDLGDDGAVGPYAFGNCAQPSLPAASVADVGRADDYRVDADPAIAADRNGGAMALWVEPQRGAWPALTPRLMFARTTAAGWSSPQPVLGAPAAISNPQLVFLADGRALAVWAQNRAPLSEIARRGGAELGEQELVSAVWDGTRWGPEVWLTADLAADGMPVLVAHPDGGAIVAWVRKQLTGEEPTPHDPIGIATMRFDGASWGPIATIDPPAGAIDAQPSLAISSRGAASLAFLRDVDGDLATVDDRAIWIAPVASRSDQASRPVPGLPLGAFSPELAFDADGRALIAFLVPGELRSGQRHDGSGSGSSLWFARERADGWQIAAVGARTRVEEPKIAALSEQRVVIAGRLFSQDRSDSQYGELFAATTTLVDGPARWSIGRVSGDGETNWQPALAVAEGREVGSGALWIAAVKQPPSDDPTRASQGALPRTAGGARLTTLDDTQGVLRVTATELPLDHDLALNAAPLAFSNPHPRSGETIRIGATVTGRGLATVPAGAAAVRFFAAEHAGRPPREIGLQRLDAPIGLGDEAVVAIDYRVPGRGEVTITAVLELDPAFGERRRADNTRGGTIGRPAPPLHLLVLVPPGAEHPILRWDPPAVDDPPAAYRIFRADSTDRTLEPIAVVSEPRFVDQLASAGDRFVYAVEAIDECGVGSERSATASAGPGR